MKTLLTLLITALFFTSCSSSNTPGIGENNKTYRVKNLSVHAIILRELPSGYAAGDTIVLGMIKTTRIYGVIQ